jgi:hypothetical protein
MKKYTLAVIFLLFAFALAAAGSSTDDARYLEKEITFTLNPDGSWQKEYHHKVKLETYLAFTRMMGETFISYNPRFQELKILKSETTMKNGRKVQSPTNAFNEVLPRRAHHFPLYSGLREMVVTHTGLERGAVVELKYILKTKAGFIPYFSGREFIADRVPVNRLVINISVPQDKKLSYRVFNAEGKALVHKDSNRTRYSFTFEGLESYFGERLNGNASRPAIVFSTANKWDAVFPCYEKTGPLPEKAAKKVEEMKTDAGTEDDFFFKLQGLVADDIDTCRVGMDLGGFIPRKLQEVYDSNYGTVIEKTYLMYHMLKQVKIPAEIVAVPYDRQLAKDVPTLAQVERFLVKAKSKAGKFLYLDPLQNGRRFYPHKLGGVTVYNLQKKSFEEFKSCACSGVAISGKVKLEEKKITGDLNVSVKGYFYPYRSALKDSKAALLKVVKGVLPVSKLEVKKITLLTPSQITAAVSVEGDFLKELYNDRYRVDKFKFPYFVEDYMFFLTKRKTPVYLDTAFNCKVKLEVEIPDDMEITFLAPLVSVKNDVGYYTHEASSASEKEGVVTLRMSMGFSKSVVGPGAYPEFWEIDSKYFVREPLMMLKKK